MNEGKEPAPPGDFDTRLHQALERRREREKGGAKAPGSDVRSGLNLAMRIGIELVAALAVGTGIGLLLDRWLGTVPWLMLVFVFLGGAAGILNVIRLSKGMGGTVGYRRASHAAPSEDDDEEGR
jgi:ATP synthase protein I